MYVDIKRLSQHTDMYKYFWYVKNIHIAFGIYDSYNDMYKYIKENNVRALNS